MAKAQVLRTIHNPGSVVGPLGSGGSPKIMKRKRKIPDSQYPRSNIDFLDTSTIGLNLLRVCGLAISNVPLVVGSACLQNLCSTIPFYAPVKSTASRFADKDGVNRDYEIVLTGNESPKLNENKSPPEWEYTSLDKSWLAEDDFLLPPDEEEEAEIWNELDEQRVKVERVWIQDRTRESRPGMPGRQRRVSNTLNERISKMMIRKLRDEDFLGQC